MPIELDTVDKLEYHFYPVSSGVVQFRVRAPNDAHIALTSEPIESDPMTEIFIGGWQNTKSIIRKNRSRPDVAEANTEGFLNAGEYRGFWIRWNAGVITVGREGEAAAFLSFDDPSPHPISYIGVCTGWGASGSWIIEGGPEFKTPDSLKYKYNAVDRGAISVNFKGPSNCHIGLFAGKADKIPKTELILGGWENQASVIRVDGKQPHKVRVETPNLVSSSRFVTFYILWDKGYLSVRNSGPNGPIIIDGKNCVNFPVSHIGVRTAWGATGKWQITFGEQNKLILAPGRPIVTPAAAGNFKPKDQSSQYSSAPQPCAVSGSACWVPSTGGQVPPGAVAGGNDGEPLFIARARFGGALIPGKLVPSHGVAYVPWGGAEHGVPEYEVLCGGGSWVRGQGSNIPPNAVPAGESEEGEPLFIGRAHHEGTITVGKVQPSHGCVYIPYGGEELRYEDYEIFVN